MNRILRTSGLLLTIGLVLTALCSCQFPPMSRNNAIETAVKWCRLAPLPEDRSGEKVTVNGEALTREIEIAFRADPAAVQAWMDASPGLQDAEGDFSGNRSTFFVIPDQAAACTVQINLDTGEVVIQTYWS